MARFLVGQREKKDKTLTRSDHPRFNRDADPRDDHRTELERQARHLATYAASVNWQPGGNTREWLLGLRDLIEHVQALTPPNPGEMTSDLNLEYLDNDPDEDACEGCNVTGMALFTTADKVQLCEECFKPASEKAVWKRKGYTSDVGLAPVQPTRFVIEGRCATKGSTRSFVSTVTGKVVTLADNVRLKDWTRTAKIMARAAKVPMADKPEGVALRVWFEFVRPKTSKATRPTVRPDIDKCLRAVLDALTGVAYADDSQVAYIKASKDYGPTDRVIVEVSRVA